jgi:hypothetical protein
MSVITRIGRGGACGLGACLLGAAAGGQSAVAGPPDGAATRAYQPLHFQDGPFERIASFPVFRNTSVDEQTVAEIVATTPDGMTLVYTDSATENVGFVDVTDPASPQPGGVVAVGGEPTSVATKDGYALACVNTSVDFLQTSGDLVVIDVATRQIVRTLPLGGQPDAIAISPNGKYAVIAIENERDEDLGSGEPPQAPPGFVVIVDMLGPIDQWSTRTVDLVGVPDLFPEDPEPEYVDVNQANVAVVTLQENNHVVLIHVPTGMILHDFPAGEANLEGIDATEDDVIVQDESLFGVPREPDAVVWTSNLTFVTADEGDLFGGSRGFTSWTQWGAPLHQAGSSVDRIAARIGHYPESRSENKGCEPEGVEVGKFSQGRFLFVGAERANVVLVYQLFFHPLFGAAFPLFRQALPTGLGPEGLLAVPQRDLFVVACEEDSREDGIRATVMIYALTGGSSYPTIRSDDHPGTDQPIPWAALSGLAADPHAGATAYSIYDSYYDASRIYTLDVSSQPAVITAELPLVDAQDVLLDALVALKAALPGTDDFDPTDVVGADGTVNLDPEGVAALADGTFWVASEGAGNLVDGQSDDDEPFESPNVLVHVAADGVILDVVLPPLELTRDQLRFGFEGVAADGDQLYAAFQREWKDAGDPSGLVRIGRYDLATGAWGFAHYPLDAVASPNGGWVGLSDLTVLADGRLALLERDNQAGPDAAVKRITTVDVAGVAFLDETQVASFPVLAKTLELDLLAAGAFAPTGGPVPEKLEGLCVLADGTTLVVNDNDGVEDNNGETQLLRLDGLFE